MFLKCDLSTFSLKSLNIKFDVILVEPPLEEYQRTMGVTNTKLWNWKQVNFNIYSIVTLYFALGTLIHKFVTLLISFSPVPPTS